MEGRIAIITGAGSGIGRAAALALWEAGYYAGAGGQARGETCRRRSPMAGVSPDDRALVIPTDVSDRQAVVRLVCRDESALRPAGCAIQQCRYGRAALDPWKT